MDIFASLGIVILAMLIMASMQLTPGVFSLFYHYALGKHSPKFASVLSLYFILGVETISACLFLSSFYLTNIIFFNYPYPEHSFLAWILCGILIALSIATLLFYYRKGSGTQLFLSRDSARTFIVNAKKTSSRSDAFLLGAISSICELPFTFPLFLLTSVEIVEMNTIFFPSNLLTIIYILTPTIPLFFIRWRFQTGSNLANIQKSRVRDKHFNRLFISACYIIIVILMITFRITV